MTIRWSCASYDEDIALVVHRLLREEDVSALTMRGVARGARLSPGTLAHHYESKDLMIARCGRAIGRLLVDDLASRLAVALGIAERLSELVARDEEELHDVKVWLDLVAMGRTSPHLGGHIRDAEDRLEEVLGRHLEDSAVPGAAHLVWLALQAVWAHQLTPERELDADEARSMLLRILPPELRS